MSKDIHEKPFDEATLVKLSIFRDYTREWLPVFIAAKQIYWNTLNIVDFFAGPGNDIKNTPGSPQIILSELTTHLPLIRSKNLKVNIYFNEFKKKKYDELVKFIEENKKEFPEFNFEITNLDFKVAYQNWYPKINKKDCANLLFFDQNGIKHIDESVFQQIIALKSTDFLFFVSSAHARRFSEHENIKQYLKLNKADIDSTPYYHIHKLVQEYYKGLIPKGKEYYLGRFSLRKDSGNIYGLIFGSGHVLGMEKFLKSCWKIDPERGEANYDIDKDAIMPGQIDMFTGEVKKPKKKEIFESNLEKYILDKTLTNDKQIYLHTVTNGFLASHASEVLKKMQKDKKIKIFKGTLNSSVCKKGIATISIEII
ncbi:MAG: three-Cys-motif partner protein TcmP [Bacteroidetes bacterium]|nr:three-Cys-motif partner protein TcmP [Bacteroidota bacterium]